MEAKTTKKKVEASKQRRGSFPKIFAKLKEEPVTKAELEELRRQNQQLLIRLDQQQDRLEKLDRLTSSLLANLPLALFNAIERGDVDSVNIFLAQQKTLANIKMTRHDVYTSAFDYAVQLGHLGIVDLFLKDNVQSTEDSLSYAAKGKYADVMQKLVAQNPDLPREKALYISAAKGDVATLGVLLEAKTTTPQAPNYHKERALIKAVENRRVNAVKKILAAGADANAQGNACHKVLYIAASQGDAPVVQALLEAKTKPELESKIPQTHTTPLMIAAQRGHVKVARALVDAGADLTTTDMRGRTALFHAYRAGQMKVVKLLCEKGADVSQRQLIIALCIEACHGGHAVKMKWLIQYANLARAELFPQGVLKELFDFVGEIQSLLVNDFSWQLLQVPYHANKYARENPFPVPLASMSEEKLCKSAIDKVLDVHLHSKTDQLSNKLREKLERNKASVVSSLATLWGFSSVFYRSNSALVIMTYEFFYEVYYNAFLAQRMKADSHDTSSIPEVKMTDEAQISLTEIMGCVENLKQLLSKQTSDPAIKQYQQLALSKLDEVDVSTHPMKIYAAAKTFYTLSSSRLSTEIQQTMLPHLAAIQDLVKKVPSKIPSSNRSEAEPETHFFKPAVTVKGADPGVDSHAVCSTSSPLGTIQ